MDARTKKNQVAEQTEEAHVVAEAISAKRDRLLASLTLIAGIGLIVALPFALREGAEFFLPVTAALVVAIALVPLLEWFERRGVPSRLAAGLCVIIFLVVFFFVIGTIVIPATDWVSQVPGRIPKIQAALQPVLDLYKSFDRFVEIMTAQSCWAQQGKDANVMLKKVFNMTAVDWSNASAYWSQKMSTDIKLMTEQFPVLQDKYTKKYMAGVEDPDADLDV